jgi:hypothetical protein
LRSFRNYSGSAATEPRRSGHARPGTTLSRSNALNPQNTAGIDGVNMLRLIEAAARRRGDDPAELAASTALVSASELHAPASKTEVELKQVAERLRGLAREVERAGDVTG